MNFRNNLIYVYDDKSLKWNSFKKNEFKKRFDLTEEQCKRAIQSCKLGRLVVYKILNYQDDPDK